MRVWRATPGRPAQHGADSVFVGATRYSGPLAWLRLSRGWFAMVAQMRRLPGYRGHGVYYEPPWTLGTVGFFSTREDLMTFARTGEHRALMQWVVGGDVPADDPRSRRNATGGYIRLYEAADDASGQVERGSEQEGERAHR